MYQIPVLMVTHNEALWEHWQTVDKQQWMPARGRGMADIERWQQQKRHLVMLDAALPQLPQWSDLQWSLLLPKTQMLVLSCNPHDVEGQKVMAAGASGYAHAYSPASVLDTILRSIATGNIWLGKQLLQRLLKDVNDRLPPAAAPDCLQLLSAREQDVARLAATGHSNQDIADQLAITERTVRAHLTAIFDKLQVQDRLMLALKLHGIHSRH